MATPTNFASLTGPTQPLAVFDQILYSSTSATQGAGAIGLGRLAYASGTVGAALQQVATLCGIFGAVGDGVTDDTAAIQAALNSTANNIDGEGKSYLISAGLTKAVAANAAFAFKNANFVSSGVPNNTSFLKISGPGVTSTLTINTAVKGASSLTLPSGTVSAGAYLQVSGTNLWNDTAVNTYPSVTMAEWATVQSQVGTTVNLTAPLSYDYSAGPTILVTGLASLICVENVSGTSDNTGFAHIAVRIDYAFNAVARNVTGVKCSNAGLAFYTCYYGYSENCGNFDPSVGLGLAYGVVTAFTTRDVCHVRPRGRGCRHIVAHGGYVGVIANCTVISPVGDNQNEGVVDSHASVDQQSVLFASSGNGTLSNGKLISCQARRLKVVGCSVDGIANGIVWNPACTAYPSALQIEDCNIRAVTSAVLVGITSTQVCEFISISGFFEGGITGVSGDGIQITHSSNLTTTGATPGKIQTVFIRGTAKSQQRGIYILGSARAQTFGDIYIDAYCKAPNVAGSYPMYIVPTNQADSNYIRVRGTFDGGATHTVRFDNCNVVDADIYAMNIVTDAIFNNKSADADAYNRFKLRAMIPSAGGANNQHYGTVVANGTTAVVVSNTLARAGSVIVYALKTVGGTPGIPYTSAISSGTSFSFKSSAGDTSTYNWWLENPVTGP